MRHTISEILFEREFFNTIDSAAVRSVLWDKDTLVVEFTNKAVYAYYGVPKDVWMSLQAAKSRGEQFHLDVKDKYNYKRLR